MVAESPKLRAYTGEEEIGPSGLLSSRLRLFSKCGLRNRLFLPPVEWVQRDKVKFSIIITFKNLSVLCPIKADPKSLMAPTKTIWRLNKKLIQSKCRELLSLPLRSKILLKDSPIISIVT